MSRIERLIQVSAADRAVWSMLIVITVKDRYSEPLVDETVHVSLEGQHGTLEAAHHVTEQDVTTDKNGQAFVIWYEYPIFEPRQDLDSPICVSCEAEYAEIEMKSIISFQGM